MYGDLSVSGLPLVPGLETLRVGEARSPTSQLSDRCKPVFLLYCEAL